MTELQVDFEEMILDLHAIPQLKSPRTHAQHIYKQDGWNKGISFAGSFVPSRPHLPSLGPIDLF